MAQTMPRVDVRLHAHASLRQERELGAFVRYCILRIERELGARTRWVVTIKPVSSNDYASIVAVHAPGCVLESKGKGLDGALATWEAMCRMEQVLRELPH
jgi:hypothetical protein